MYDLFMDKIVSFDNFIWGPPLIILLMGVGIILTFRLGFIQFRKLPKALQYMWHNEEGADGEVSSFGALCTALAATIGTGNIVGVATAVAAGGPGALFWMLFAGFLGMATKYAEGLLAIKYRTYDKETGHAIGGPFYYIERGGKELFGFNWKPLSKAFAVFGICAGMMGIGTITQVSGIASAAKTFFDPDNRMIAFSIGTNEYSWVTVLAAIVVALAVGLVLIGGIQRIASVTTLIVPFMAIVYVICCLAILIFNADKLGSAIVLVVKSAFGNGYSPIIGGTTGALVRAAVQYGVARGIFSNESGLGSAPIASAAAKTKEPVRQGLVTMTGTFIDTIIICTMTGLSLVITGAYLTDLEGVDLTIHAFSEGLPFSHQTGAFLLLFSLALFAFTTILGWNYYSERCLEYLVGSQKFDKPFRWIWTIVVLIGPFLTLEVVWTLADIFNALMAIPNLIGLLALNGVVVFETRQYFKRLKAGEVIEFSEKLKK